MVIEKTDLAEFAEKLISQVVINNGSLKFVVENDAQIFMQCAFEYCDQEGVYFGHGERAETCSILLRCLNSYIERADLIENQVLNLIFKESGVYLRIIPEKNGLESYVITTRLGICPVIGV